MNNYNRTSRTLLDFTSEMCNFPYNDFKKDSNFKEISLIKKEYVVKKFEDKYTRLRYDRIYFNFICKFFIQAWNQNEQGKPISLYSTYAYVPKVYDATLIH